MKKILELRKLTLCVILSMMICISLSTPILARINPPDPPPPTTHPSYKIEGNVFSSTGEISGINVYLCDCIFDFGHTITDASGHFQWTGSWIQPCREYYVSVNGEYFISGRTVGAICDDYHYGQITGYVWTDQYSYANTLGMHVEAAAVVNVPMAAIYNHSPNVEVEYISSSGKEASHTTAFTVDGSGAQNGYTSGFSTSVGTSPPPNTCQVVVEQYYATTYWEGIMPPNGAGGLANTGINHVVDGLYPWDTENVNEYLSGPNDSRIVHPYYQEIKVKHGNIADIQFTETGSRTWSYTLGFDFGIKYNAYGADISLSTTVSATTSQSHTISIIINLRGFPLDGQYEYFKIFTPGTTLGVDFSDPNNPIAVGGLEIHIWDTTSFLTK